MSHQPRLCVTPNFSKMGSSFQMPKFIVFRRNFYQKLLKVCYKFYCLKTSSGEVVAQSTTCRMVSTFWQGMAPFPKNVGLKALTPNTKDAPFTFHTQRAVQSAIADLSCHKTSCYYAVLLWEEAFPFWVDPTQNGRMTAISFLISVTAYGIWYAIYVSAT